MAAGFKVDSAQFWDDGYTIVRGVFSRSEIEDFRQRSFEARGKHGGDLLSNPYLNGILLDGRLVDIARQILGRDDVVYYGDGAIAIREGNPGWHKDNADRKDPDAPDWASPYTQLRFGVYLQDHHRHSGGLNVRVGSHETVSHTEGRPIQLRTKVGDVGVWSMRITHSAAATLLKWWPGRDRHPDPFELDQVEPKHILPRDKERIAVFLALGADDDHLERYVQYLKTRRYIVNTWMKSRYDDEVRARAAEIGLTIRDMRAEIEGDATVGRNEAWQPLPY